MWRSRRKSSREIDNTDGLIRTSSSNLNFIRSSLKDVENLFADDDTNGFIKTLAQPSPSTTTTGRRLSIFHRVHLANKFTRAFASNQSPNSLKSQPDSTVSDSPDRSTKSNRPISIPDSPEKFAKSDRPISILNSTDFDSPEKLTKSDCQILIPDSTDFDSSEKLAKSNRLISIPDPKVSDSPVKSSKPDRLISLPGSEKRVVIYTTSLRVVRSTFEACKTVKSILQSFRVSIDERDLSMDSRYLHELHNLMCEQTGEENVEMTKLPLPRVFIGGKYIGGAEEVKQLHETGELKKVVERLPAVVTGVCQVCGGFRFVVCDECSGSRKCYSEKCGFRSCTLCNENGLVRCPVCLGS